VRRRFFAGILDEARIGNYARTAQQIADGTNLEIPSATVLLGRWGLNEGSGTVANDRSGHNVNGTLVNGLGVDTVASAPIRDPLHVDARVLIFTSARPQARSFGGGQTSPRLAVWRFVQLVVSLIRAWMSPLFLRTEHMSPLAIACPSTIYYYAWDADRDPRGRMPQLLLREPRRGLAPRCPRALGARLTRARNGRDMPWRDASPLHR